ncbi:hypothetical protein DV965_17205, partial [Staphylococcus pseudintermedius]
FSYFLFAQATRSMLHEHRDNEIVIYDSLKLTMFSEEFDYLLDSINSNSSFGQAFVPDVEETWELE